MPTRYTFPGFRAEPSLPATGATKMLRVRIAMSHTVLRHMIGLLSCAAR